MNPSCSGSLTANIERKIKNRKILLRVKESPRKDAHTTCCNSVKKGYLYKKNEQGGWQKRYCCLVPHLFLYYYENEESLSPRGIIDLESYTYAKLMEGNLLKLSGDVSLGLRSFYFHLENTKNLESWAELIQTERYQMLKEETIAHRQINQVFANEIQFLNKSLLEKDNYIRELEKKSIERDLMLNDVINELGSLSRSVQGTGAHPSEGHFQKEKLDMHGIEDEGPLQISRRLTGEILEAFRISKQTLEKEIARRRCLTGLKDNMISALQCQVEDLKVQLERLAEERLILNQTILSNAASHQREKRLLVAEVIALRGGRAARRSPSTPVASPAQGSSPGLTEDDRGPQGELQLSNGARCKEEVSGQSLREEVGNGIPPVEGVPEGQVGAVLETSGQSPESTGAGCRMPLPSTVDKVDLLSSTENNNWRELSIVDIAASGAGTGHPLAGLGESRERPVTQAKGAVPPGRLTLEVLPGPYPISGDKDCDQCILERDEPESSCSTSIASSDDTSVTGSVGGVTPAPIRCYRCGGTVEGPRYSTCSCLEPQVTLSDTDTTPPPALLHTLSNWGASISKGVGLYRGAGVGDRPIWRNKENDPPPRNSEHKVPAAIAAEALGVGTRARTQGSEMGDLCSSRRSSLLRVTPLLPPVSVDAKDGIDEDVQSLNSTL